MSEKDVDVLKRDVAKILMYLHNDEGTGEKGLIADFKTLKKDFEDFVKKYETSQAVKKATIGAWATIGGLVALAAKHVAVFVIEHFKF